MRVLLVWALSSLIMDHGWAALHVGGHDRVMWLIIAMKWGANALPALSSHQHPPLR